MIMLTLQWLIKAKSIHAVNVNITIKLYLTICPNCHNNDTIHYIDYNPYYRALPYYPKEPPKIVIGQPCMLNPNSTEAVRYVLKHVQDMNHLNDEHHGRKWTFLHSDGVSYVYASDIQDHLLECTDSKGVLIDK